MMKTFYPDDENDDRRVMEAHKIFNIKNVSTHRFKPQL